MEGFDWRRPIQINITMLKIAGVWPAGEETYKLNLYTFYAIIFITFFNIFFNLTQTINIISSYNDLQAVISTIVVSLTLSISILKLYYLVQNMKMLKQLITTINSDIFQVKNQRQLELVQQSLNSWKKVYVVFNSTVAVAIVFFGTFPILDKSVEEHRLPFAAWFPFDYKISPFYELTYVYQIASLCFTVTVNSNIDTLIAALNMFVGAQCDILCDNLRHICGDINVKLKDSVEHHRAILRFAQHSNRFFNWIVLIQFFTSIVSLAMTMFQLTVVPPFGSEFVSYTFYGNAVLVQIFMYCWFGNEVELKSRNIPYAAFESNWTNAPAEFKKNLVLIILRSQRPIKVSALNLFYLSLGTFMAILRTSWSYFAVLHQVNAAS